VVAALIVGVFLQHREWKADRAVPLLKPIEGAVPGAEAAHWTCLGAVGERLPMPPRDSLVRRRRSLVLQTAADTAALHKAALGPGPVFRNDL